MNNDPIHQPDANAVALAELLKPLAVGEVVTYAQLNAAIPAGNVQDKHRPALAKARKTLLDDFQMVFGTVMKVGLKRLADIEVVEQGKAAVKSLNRSAGRSMKKLATVEFDALPKPEQTKHRLASVTLGAIALVTGGQSQLKLEAKLKHSQDLEVGQALKLFAKDGV